MMRFAIVSVASGFVFGVLDGVINANSYAQKFFDVYKPLSKQSINIVAGFALDILYGFIMAWLFLLLNKSLPGSTNIAKGLAFGVMIWFFRVFMTVASSWMMYKVPPQTHLYVLITGLIEMLIIGLLYGLLLKP